MKEKITRQALPILILFSIITSLFNSCRSPKEEDIVVNVAKDEFDVEDQAMIGQALDEVMEEDNNSFEILSATQYPEIYSHLNELIQQIANTPVVNRREDYSWKISVIKNDDIISTFMTPGGHLYFTTGFLKFLIAEHELVGVIAHELCYVDSDFLINRLQDEFGSKNLSKVLSKVSGYKEIALSMAEQLEHLHFRETDVKASDKYAMEIICEFSWDASGLLSLLERVENSINEIEWITSKPMYENRIEKISLMMEAGNGTCGMQDSTYHLRYNEMILDKLP